VVRDALELDDAPAAPEQLAHPVMLPDLEPVRLVELELDPLDAQGPYPPPPVPGRSGRAACLDLH
jgi:hypothetical protein